MITWTSPTATDEVCWQVDTFGALYEVTRWEGAFLSSLGYYPSHGEAVRAIEENRRISLALNPALREVTL